MTRNELRELIARGESSTLEFKRKFTTIEKIGRELIAFANTNGGYLLIGVDDDGTIVGVESEKETIAQLTQTCAAVVPPIVVNYEVVEIQYVDVVVVYVEKSTLKPHKMLYDVSLPPSNERKAFIRQGEHSVMASREMEKVLAAQSPFATPLTVSIGDRERRLFTYLERYNRASVQDFSKLANISRRRAAQILVKLVRAGVLHINTENGSDYYTLV
jgi:predicted HTH transcriptional regulator